MRFLSLWTSNLGPVDPPEHMNLVVGVAVSILPMIYPSFSEEPKSSLTDLHIHLQPSKLIIWHHLGIYHFDLDFCMHQGAARVRCRNLSALDAGMTSPTSPTPAVGTPTNAPELSKAAPPLLPPAKSASVLM